MPVSDGMLTLKEIYIHTLYLPVMDLAYHHRQVHLCVLKGNVNVHNMPANNNMLTLNRMSIHTQFIHPLHIMKGEVSYPRTNSEWYIPHL